MTINSIYETSYSGMYKVTASTDDGGQTSFFIRKEYVHNLDFDSIDSGSYYDEVQTGELLDAGLASVVELKALDYIARAEQSRFGLNRKLTDKGYDKKYIIMALDFLETTEYLDDGRFARAWLHGRQLNHYEGRVKLLAELQGRGISKEIAVQAVNDFFTENDELEICRKAYERFVKKGKTEDKLIAAMMAAGFSYKLIKDCQFD